MVTIRTYIRCASYIALSFTIAVAVYGVNILLLSSNQNMSPTDALFAEGIFALLIGCLLLLGRGGLNLSTVKAAILSASADAVFDTESVGPSEAMRIDSWKARGFILGGLILVGAGVFMLAIYFLSL